MTYRHNAEEVARALDRLERWPLQGRPLSAHLDRDLRVVVEELRAQIAEEKDRFVRNLEPPRTGPGSDPVFDPDAWTAAGGKLDHLGHPLVPPSYLADLVAEKLKDRLPILTTTSNVIAVPLADQTDRRRALDAAVASGTIITPEEALRFLTTGRTGGPDAG